MSSMAMMPLSRTLGRTETGSGMPLSPFLDRNGELLLDLVAEVRARVVGAEGDDLPVRRGVVDHAALDTLDVVVVVVLEVHAAYVHRGPGELGDAGLVPLHEHLVQAEEYLRQTHALGRLVRLE